MLTCDEHRITTLCASPFCWRTPQKKNRKVQPQSAVPPEHGHAWLWKNKTSSSTGSIKPSAGELAAHHHHQHIVFDLCRTPGSSPRPNNKQRGSVRAARNVGGGGLDCVCYVTEDSEWDSVGRGGGCLWINDSGPMEQLRWPMHWGRTRLLCTGDCSSVAVLSV